jgi:hypothetical protein
MRRIIFGYSFTYLFLLLFSGFVFYGCLPANSLHSYFQNFSLQPFGYKLAFFILLWSIVTLPFFLGIYLKNRYKTRSRFLKRALFFLSVTLVFTIFWDGYYIAKLFKISPNISMVTALIKSRYGNQAHLKTIFNKLEQSQIPDAFSGPDSYFIFNDKSGEITFSILTKEAIPDALTYYKWLRHPENVYWRMSSTGNPTHILFWWCYYRDDLPKAYVANLKTKETTLLTRGHELYDLRLAGMQ